MSARAADRIGAIALWALAAMQLVWPERRAVIGVIAVLLLAPALGMWLRSPRRGLLLGALIGLVFFSHGVMEAWSDPDSRAFGIAEAALELALVFALGWATRVEKRARKIDLPGGGPTR
jgi:uncharacterized membrane protein